MKILFICHNLTDGGAERVCVDVANGLSLLGHEVLILTDTSAPITYEPNPVVKIINQVPATGRISMRLNAFRQLYQLMKQERPDAVVSILYLYASLAKIASKLTVDCPVIASDHNAFDRPSYAKMMWRQKYDKFVLNYFLDALTVLTEADRLYLRGRYKHTYVMPNPLGMAPAPQLPQKEQVVLAVGRLNDWHYKGFDLLIGAWKLLGCQYPGWKLRIVGHGDEPTLRYLEGLAQGCQNLEFLPYTMSIKQEYQRASVFVLSSRYEGFGLVLTEAMSQGCACLACDYKGRQAEIVTDGEDGLICAVDSQQQLQAKLQQLLDDASLRSRLQHQAIKAVDRFSIPRIAKKWEEVIVEIIEGRG